MCSTIMSLLDHDSQIARIKIFWRREIYRLPCALHGKGVEFLRGFAAQLYPKIKNHGQF